MSTSRLGRFFEDLTGVSCLAALRLSLLLGVFGLLFDTAAVDRCATPAASKAAAAAPVEEPPPPPAAVALAAAADDDVDNAIDEADDDDDEDDDEEDDDDDEDDEPPPPPVALFAAVAAAATAAAAAATAAADAAAAAAAVDASGVSVPRFGRLLPVWSLACLLRVRIRDGDSSPIGSPVPDREQKVHASN